MLVNSLLAISVVSLLTLGGISHAQEDPSEDFGFFHAICSTDQMTDERTCYVYVTDAGAFEVRMYSSSAIVGNNVKRMRVDKNLALAGDCKNPQEPFPNAKVASGLKHVCHFAYIGSPTPASRELLKELSTGTTLRVELFDGTLGTYELIPFYRQALEAMQRLEKAGPPKKPTTN